MVERRVQLDQDSAGIGDRARPCRDFSVTQRPARLTQRRDCGPIKQAHQFERVGGKDPLLQVRILGALPHRLWSASLAHADVFGLAALPLRRETAIVPLTERAAANPRPAAGRIPAALGSPLAGFAGSLPESRCAATGGPYETAVHSAGRTFRRRSTLSPPESPLA